MRRRCDIDDDCVLGAKCASDSSSKTLYRVMGSAAGMIDETTICLSVTQSVCFPSRRPFAADPLGEINRVRCCVDGPACYREVLMLPECWLVICCFCSIASASRLIGALTP